MFEGKVDACADEGRGDDQAADLDLETKGAEGIVVEHNTAYVADRFAQAAEAEGDLLGMELGLVVVMVLDV